MLLSAISVADAELAPDPAIDCAQCADWNRPQQPFRIFGNTYYVGTAELASILIATNDGLILLDAALPQSAALIDANIRTLGFRVEEVRLIVSSHAHFDHVGGIAALQRASSAVVAASPSTAAALRDGKPTPDDPQYAVPNNAFPPVAAVRVIRDGEKLAVGGTEITALFTPGHTPGATTWTWRACEPERCVDVVYADSLTAVSSDGFRFTGGDTSPDIVSAFERSIRKVGSLRCDILLSPHSGFFGMRDKLQQLHEGRADAFIDARACRGYAAAAAARLAARVAQERGAR
jgi:metallo-beta-lactamase class B